MPRASSRAFAIFGVTLFFALAGSYFFQQRSRVESPLPLTTLHGRTMGTTYSIRYFSETDGPSSSQLQQQIDDELIRVNQQMSTYDPDSELSRFNDLRTTDWFDVSVETAQVVELALQISNVSDGAFDVTVGPLVNLWGFGPNRRQAEIPTQEAIAAAKSYVGYQHLSVRMKPPAIKKAIPELNVDLSSIAKGHGSDRVGSVMTANGIENYFVEIGGEIRTQGTRRDGKPWQVGIEAPLENERAIQNVIGLSGAALATSGDYRNFFRQDEHRYSHTIDPNSGRPVTHQLASASVIADNCALADAIATCMMVLGPEPGLDLAEANGWAVLLMQRQQKEIVSTYSTRFAELCPGVCDQLSKAR